ncbi:cytochrome c [Pendulispora brunnea]|uniref:Cytochrome c n=1 Tax=Pendulispora brunnea TaxID=2905690 RepID=A0ABZ2JVY4_9BACT
MSKRANSVLASALALALISATTLAENPDPAKPLVSPLEPPRYAVGRPATAEEIAARDISVSPTGAGLPAGSGTAAQGRAVYEQRCAGCHGLRGEGVGDDYPALAGGGGTLATNHPVLTVGSYWPYATTVWDYIHRAMPYETPGTLRPDEVYAVTAYVLFLNGIVHEDAIIDARTLAAVHMPNRDGFIGDPRPDVAAR